MTRTSVFTLDFPDIRSWANNVVHAAEHEDVDGGDDGSLDQVPAEHKPQGGGNPDEGRAAPPTDERVGGWATQQKVSDSDID